MAERRMFAKSIIGSARFLRMPPASRLLYYDLGMTADDDGIVEAFTVIRTTGATEDDLRVLAAKGFVTVLNDDLVSYIRDWGTNNQIRKDRYHPSVYAELLVKIGSGAVVETDGLPFGNQMETEVRLGKVSIGEDKEETILPPFDHGDQPPCRLHGPQGYGRPGRRVGSLAHHPASAEITGGPLVQQGAATHRKETSTWTGFVC